MKDPWLASQEAAQSCCRACGGKLHRADDPRKARGVPHKLMEQWDRRYGFCCSTEGCRLRHTPVSVRFLGRKVYSEVFVVLISALMNGPNERRTGELHREKNRVDSADVAIVEEIKNRRFNSGRKKFIKTMKMLFCQLAKEYLK